MGKVATVWAERGIALGGMFHQLPSDTQTAKAHLVIIFVTLLHGFMPHVGVRIMNVSIRPCHLVSGYYLTILHFSC